MSKFEEFLVENSLYDRLTVVPSDLYELKSFLNKGTTIRTYCKDCKDNSVFNCKKSNFVDISEQIIKPIPNASPQERILIQLIRNNKFINLVYDCAKKEEHKYTYNLVLGCDVKNKDYYIMKIGQYPSYADIEIPNIKKYKKILGDEKYKEYKRAMALYSCNVGVGSFVYLRRIIEKLVLVDAYKEALKDDKGIKDKLNGKRFNEKMELLKEYLPDTLSDFEPYLYPILSKGVHEFKEEECLKYFMVVKGAIDLILSDILYKIDTEKAKSETTKELSRIHSELKQ